MRSREPNRIGRCTKSTRGATRYAKKTESTTSRITVVSLSITHAHARAGRQIANTQTAQTDVSRLTDADLFSAACVFDRQANFVGHTVTREFAPLLKRLGVKGCTLGHKRFSLHQVLDYDNSSSS